jgi:hypothetical protein
MWFSSVIVALVMAAGVFAIDFNSNGYLDTMRVNFPYDTLTKNYSKVFNNTNYASAAIVNSCYFSGTVCAGYTKDTAVFSYGYRLGFQTYTTSDTARIAWTKDVIVDTINTGLVSKLQATVAKAWQNDTLCTAYYPRGVYDTVTNKAIMQYISVRSIIPKWSPFIQLWIQPISTKCATRRVNVITTINRQLYSPAR